MAERRGESSIVFHVADLDAETTRLAGAGHELGTAFRVAGFTDLRHIESRDPEGVPVGLLDGE